MKIPRQTSPSPLTVERRNTPSTQGLPIPDSAQSKQGKQGKSTGGDTFQKAQGASIFGQQMGVGKAKGLGSQASKPNSMASMVLAETIKVLTTDAKASRSALSEAFASKVSTQTANKATMNTQQAKEHNQAWVNVGVAVATSVKSLVGSAVAGGSAAVSSTQDMAGGLSQTLNEVSSQLSKGNTADAMATWGEGLKTALGRDPSNVDVNALIQLVMRESYMENTEDLKFFAEKVKHFNEQKKEIRGYLQEVRESRSNLQEPDFLHDPPFPFPELAPSPIHLEDLSNLGEKLQNVGDDAQLANVDMQNWLQKQQQTLQMMSNISKTMQDTAMAVVRKLG